MSPLPSLLASAIPFALPLTREFRGLSVREGMLLEGPAGWGEFAPFDDYTDAAAARWLVAALEAATTPWPDPVHASVPVNAIVPAVGPSDAQALTRAALAQGCTTIKVKVGSADLADDIARVAAVRAALDEAATPGAIRVDANAAWTLAQAQVALEALARFGLQYVEQPCRELADLARLRRAGIVRIAVDEGIRTSADPASLQLREVADIAILKPQPLGGIAATLDLAERLDLPVVVSGSLDSSVGLAAVVAAAAALPGPLPACGLGTGALLADDLLVAPLAPTTGVLWPGRVAPDQQALERARARVSDERRAFWQHRLSAAWDLVAKDPILRDRVGA